MTLADRILEILRRTGDEWDDDQLAARLGVRRQHVNQVCRKLHTDGAISRHTGRNGKLVNRATQGASTGPAATDSPAWVAESGDAEPPSLEPPVAVVAGEGTGLISEDEVKQSVAALLEADGFEVRVAWGRQRGIDIEARRGADRWVIEAKGEVALQPQQHNYFVGALGNLLQRFDDDAARYGLALPDNAQYRGLANRLPALAWERIRLAIFFVQRVGGELVVELIEKPSPRRPAW